MLLVILQAICMQETFRILHILGGKGGKGEAGKKGRKDGEGMEGRKGGTKEWREGGREEKL